MEVEFGSGFEKRKKKTTHNTQKPKKAPEQTQTLPKDYTLPIPCQRLQSLCGFFMFSLEAGWLYAGLQNFQC